MTFSPPPGVRACCTLPLEPESASGVGSGGPQRVSVAANARAKTNRIWRRMGLLRGVCEFLVLPESGCVVTCGLATRLPALMTGAWNLIIDPVRPGRARCRGEQQRRGHG